MEYTLFARKIWSSSGIQYQLSLGKRMVLGRKALPLPRKKMVSGQKADFP